MHHRKETKLIDAREYQNQWALKLLLNIHSWIYEFTLRAKNIFFSLHVSPFYYFKWDGCYTWIFLSTIYSIRVCMNAACGFIHCLLAIWTKKVKEREREYELNEKKYFPWSSSVFAELHTTFILSALVREKIHCSVSRKEKKNKIRKYKNYFMCFQHTKYVNMGGWHAKIHSSNMLYFIPLEYGIYVK